MKGNRMKIYVEYYEYECGNICTSDGCMGHITDIPVGIHIDNVLFYVDGYEGGDYPLNDIKQIEKVKEVIERLSKIIKEIE